MSLVIFKARIYIYIKILKARKDLARSGEAWKPDIVKLHGFELGQRCVIVHHAAWLWHPSRACGSQMAVPKPEALHPRL